MTAPTYLYRFEARRFSSVIDAEREEYGVTPPTLVLQKLPVISETPCGYWVRSSDAPWASKHWVSKTARRRLAHPTEDEAKAAYRERKKAYLNHCLRRSGRAKEELALAEDPFLIAPAP